MQIHAGNRFLRNHFHSGPKRVMVLSDRRLIIHAAGLHCSLDGKLPNAYNERLDVTTFQLALKNSHSKVYKLTKLISNKMIKLIIVLDIFENKVLLIFLKKFINELTLALNINNIFLS